MGVSPNFHTFKDSKHAIVAILILTETLVERSTQNEKRVQAPGPEHMYPPRERACFLEGIFCSVSCVYLKKKKEGRKEPSSVGCLYPRESLK